MAQKRKTPRGANRLRKALRAVGMEDEMLALCGELIASVGFLEDALWNARVDLVCAPLVVEYDNGGGQSGTRKNPAFDAYAKLYQQYLQGLRLLIDRIPDAQVADVISTDAASTMEALRKIEQERANG